jgi:hypothetical protein
MKLTQTHVNFWHAHLQQPRWIAIMQDRSPAIDACVNAHAGVRERDSTAYNLLALCEGQKRRGDLLLPFLLQVAANPGTLINPARRAAFARKWAARIKRVPVVA